MRFLAIREDRQPAPDVWRNYVHKLNVNCRGCGQTYQLWAPMGTEDEIAIKAEAERLRTQLAEDCSGHPDWFEMAGR